MTFCTQSVLKPHSKSPETRINTGFPSSIFLFKLDRCRWFSGAIVHDAVDVFDFVYDSTGCSSDDIPRDFGAFGGHEIGGGDGAEGDGVIVGSFNNLQMT